MIYFLPPESITEFGQMDNKYKSCLDIREIQKISLEILKFVTSICETNNFKYCLIYGTLIGAVRHKGYIPWDDDVDIMMPRPDYEKFLKYAESHKDEFGVYQIFNRNTNHDYIYSITRVSDSRYEIFKSDEKNCGMGIFIDIYPFDGLGNDYDKALGLLCRTRRICDTIVDITRTDFHLQKSLNWKGKLSMVTMRIFNKIRGLNYFNSKLIGMSKIHSYTDSRYVGPLMWFFTKPEKILFDKDLFSEFVKVKFEDGEFYAPKAYDKILTQAYGNYMQLPSPEKRIYHHQYKAYRK